MTDERMRNIAIMALAQNAQPDDAQQVLSHALDGLLAEAKVLRAGLESGEDITVLAFSHESRIEALEDLFDHYMSASWKEPARAQAAE